MIRFLRTASTKGLLIAAIASVGVLACGAVIASGAGGDGSKPRPKPLAQAVSDSLAGSNGFKGVSARVEFQNSMLGSIQLPAGSDPLTGGGSGRLWATEDGRVRIELQSDGGGSDVQLVVNRDEAWISDAALGQAWKVAIPKRTADRPDAKSKIEWPPGVEAVAKAIEAISGDTNLSAAAPDNVGGRPAYTVTISPKDTSGLFAGGRVSWDAANGAPLAVAILARGQDQPAMSIRATSAEFGPVDASVFEIPAPAAAKQVEVPTKRPDSAPTKRDWKPVKGRDAVQSKLDFNLNAPSRIAGRNRSEVVLVGSGKQAAAVITYGSGLSAIAVVERAAGKPATSRSSDMPQLPTIKVGGVDATRLSTPLGSIVSFSRDGIEYTVAGSVTGAVAASAAADLG